jgi:hypothetical protein
MEKFNVESDCSSIISDTDSFDQENSFLFNFIFENRQQGRDEGKDIMALGSLNLGKEENKLNPKECLKTAKPNGRSKKQVTNPKKDTESPYRKVLVTTDLRSDMRSSTYFKA